MTQVLLLLGVASCGDSPLGLGIGLPPFSERPAQGPSGLVLSRAYIPAPGSTAVGFVELYNGSGHLVDLARTPMTLESPSGSIALDSGTWADSSVLQVLGSSFAALSLHAQAGELVLLDSNLVVGAYGAWGNDPNGTLGSFAPLAQSSGQSASWRELPFPLADGQAIALDAGRPDVTCTSATPGAAYPQAAVGCTAGPAPSIWLSRVVPQGLDGNGSAIELYNAGTSAVDVWGLKLCRATGSCVTLYPHAQEQNDAAASVLAPASALATGAADAARRRIVFVDGLATSAQDLLTTLSPIHTNEELALAAPGSLTAAALSYVRLQPLGSAPSAPTLTAPLVPAATQALWQSGLTPPRVAGESLALMVGATGAPSTPAAWRYSALPFGTALSDPNAPWDACTAPQAPVAPSVALDQIVPWDFAGTALVAVMNIGTAPLSPATLALEFGSTTIALTGAALAPNDTLWVALTGDADCSGLGVSVDVCASNTPMPLASNEMLLTNNAVPQSFVQWSAGSAHAAAAVAAHIWPQSQCSVAHAPSYADVQRLVRLAGAAGQSPADYILARQLSVH